MSIRIKLTIIMLAIGLVPTVLVSAISYATISNELTRKTADQLTSIASSQQQTINGLLQKKQEEATKLSNQFDLQSAVGTYIDSNHKSGTTDIYNILLNKKVATPDIQTIDLVGLDGTIITSTVTGSEGKKLASDDYYVPDGQESNISVKEDSRDGIDKLYITSKISVNKKESGYINLIFRIDDIVAAVQDYTGLGSTGETMLAAQDAHNNAVSLFPLRFDTDAALKTNLNSLALFNANEPLYQQATDYRGHTVMVAARPIGFANWVIATKIDMDEALAPITQLRTALLAILVVSSIGIVMFSLYFTRFFTKPILRVAQVAQSFGRGDFSLRVDFQRNDEIGTLGESINTMGRSLQEFVTSIESQRNRLEIILNSTTESIMAINQEGRIILANAATKELTQRGQEIVGQYINDVFTWKQDLQTFVIDYTKPGVNIYANLQYTDASGITHYLKLIVAKLKNESEPQAPQAIITVHDETKSRELENMKVDFVSMAAHELRTPLAATRGYLELITYKEGAKIAPDVKNYLQQALKSTSELGSLIDNLLGVTRIERGTLTLHPEKLDLAADIQQAIQSANFAAADKRITLHYDGPASGCFIIADQLSFHEVINNLLTNAIKYTDTGGDVIVTLSHEGSNYVARFKDTGIGIPKQALPNLFTKFYRVHGGLNSGSTGTGLGLFIAKSIIERHGGTIGVVSEEGIGSTFTITVPVLDPKRFADLQAHIAQHATRGNRGWTTKNITR